MGAVWKARHVHLNRIVALKLVYAGCLPGEQADRRFQREAESAAKLCHPNIVAIHEVGKIEDQLYLTMDFLEGGSVAERAGQEDFSLREAAILMAKVAHGVHHAHENGILHRDIKPANILLDATGEPQVCDFGLARIMDETSDLTVLGEILGTPAYLSPEQIEGRKDTLTPSSDIYSLGAVLYELLSGEPPFPSEQVHVIARMVVEEMPGRLLASCSGVRIPVDLSTICMKCLEKDPKNRYATALGLAEDLERWIRGEPILARRTAPAERLWKWARRKPLVASLWFLVTVLLLVVAGVATVLELRVEKQRAIAEDLARRSQHRLARQLSQSAQHLIEQHDWLRGMPALAEAIRIGTGNRRLDEVNRIRFGVLLRNAPGLRAAWFSGEPIFRAEGNQSGTRLMLATRRTVEVWDVEKGERIGGRYTPDAGISNVSFDSAQGRWASVETAGGRCHVWRPDDGVVRDVGEGSVHSPPDGYLLREGLFVLFKDASWEVQAAMRDERISGPFKCVSRIRWAAALPGLTRVIACDEDDAVHLWDMRTGVDLVPPIKLGAGSRGIAFDGFNSFTRTAVLHRSRECWVLDCMSGEILVYHENLADIPQSFGRDANGEWVFLTRNDEGVAVRNLATDVLRWPAFHGALGFRGSFAPDSRLLATQSWIGSARVWETDNGTPVTPYLWQTATPGSCLLTPGGKWLLTRGDEPGARLWNLRANNGTVEMPGTLQGGRHLFFAGDPERLVGAETNGRVVVWDPGEPPKQLLEFQHPEELAVVAPAGRGKFVLTAGSRTAALWDIRTGKIFGHRFMPDVPILHASADPNETTFAAVLAGGDIVVWDAGKGAERVRIRASAQRVVISPDGRLLLALSGRVARTWDARTGKAASAPVEEAGGPCMQFSARTENGSCSGAAWAPLGRAAQGCGMRRRGVSGSHFHRTGWGCVAWRGARTGRGLPPAAAIRLFTSATAARVKPWCRR